MRTQSKGILGILIPDGSPASVLALGLCCSLAVTTRISDTLIAGIVLTAVSACSGIVLSLIRKILPQQIDIVIETLVVTGLVLLAARAAGDCGWELTPALVADMGLIALNSVLFSRRKPFALRHNPASAAFEGLLRGVAYTVMMLIVALLREVLGFFSLMAYPPMALIIFGIMLWMLIRNDEDMPRLHLTLPDACRTGLSSFVVIMLSMPLIWLMDRYVLDPGALSWAGFSFESMDLSGIGFAVMALIIVTVSRAVRTVAVRTGAADSTSVDVYFPIISVNAAILSARLIPFGECSLGLLPFNAAIAGLACFTAMAVFGAISDKTAYSDVPKGLRGPGIAFIIAGLAGLAAMAFFGIKI